MTSPFVLLPVKPLPFGARIEVMSPSPSVTCTLPGPHGFNGALPTATFVIVPPEPEEVLKHPV